MAGRSNGDMADRLDGWMAGWLDGWMAGWLDGWMAGWLDGWISWTGLSRLTGYPEPQTLYKALQNSARSREP